MPTSDGQKYKLVICFAPEDQGYCLDLMKHLALLEQKGLIEIWHPGKVNPGEALDVALEMNASKAQLLMALLTGDLLAKFDSHEKYLAAALERQNRGEARVIPIQTRACDWSLTLLRDLVVIPKKPVVEWRNRDRAWNEVTKATLKAVEELKLAENERQEQVRWTLVLTGNFKDVDKPLLDAMLAHLRKLSGDFQITLEKYYPGSIILIIKSSKYTYSNLKKQNKQGSFEHILGLPVHSIKIGVNFSFLTASFIGISVRAVKIATSVVLILFSSIGLYYGLKKIPYWRVSGRMEFTPNKTPSKPEVKRTASPLPSQAKASISPRSSQEERITDLKAMVFNKENGVFEDADTARKFNLLYSWLLVTVEVHGPLGDFAPRVELLVKNGTRVYKNTSRNTYSDSGKHYAVFLLDDMGCERVSLEAKLANNSIPPMIIRKSIDFTCAK